MDNTPVVHAKPPHRVQVGGLGIDHVTVSELESLIAQGWEQGQGGLIITPNVDIWRTTRRSPDCAAMVARARLVVADGAPVLWASKLAGQALPERITGSGLVETLSALAAARGRSVYLLGGGVGDCAERAADALAARYPGLQIAGTMAPPFGFMENPETLQSVVARVVRTDPGLVLTGLGFPRQERLAERLHMQTPATWILGCGAGIAMAAGDIQRPSATVQRLGLEWLVRLSQEPRRLARRYLVDDVPAALSLLASSVVQRRRGTTPAVERGMGSAGG